MKKLLFAIAILFSVSCSAQDTTYYYNRYELYRNIATRVVDTPTLMKYKAFEIKRIKRKSRVFTIVSLTIFAGISAWYWSK